MRRTLAKLLAGAAIAAVAMYGADNSIGTWKRNMEKSKTTATNPNPVTSLTIVYEAADGGVKSTVTGTRKDGTPINSTSTFKYDGKEYPVMGARWDTTSVKQIDANTFTSQSKKSDGKYRATARSVISKDGKSMTTTVKGTDEDGKHFTSTMVYDKQ